jgi:deoxyribose-phosphate aldolase
MMAEVTYRELAKTIDHSLLHPALTDADIRLGCELAAGYGTATVCVKPYAVAMCRDLLAGSGVNACSVIAFPHGNSTPAIKVAETAQALADGAVEIDMVVNIGKVLGGDWGYVASEIEAVNDACRSSHALLKVIFETDFLPDDHILGLCDVCSHLQVAFVKTSTGYGFVKQPNGCYSYQGATDHVLSLMRSRVDTSVQVKAAGGVRTLDDLLRVRSLGVTRVGATATQAILDEARARGYTG